MYRQHQESQQRANSNRATQSENDREYENHPERYYNGRDYRREQQLEEEMKNQAKLKMADCNHSYFTHYCSYLYHACNYQS